MSRVEKKNRWQSLVWLPLLAVSFGPVAQAFDPDSLPVPETATRLTPRPFTWSPVETKLPASIKVFTGDGVNTDGQPLHAWYADIDYTDRSLQVKAFLSRSATGRETSSEMAREVGALIATNASYFDMEKVPSPTYNTIISDGKVLSKNPETARRSGKTFYSARGVFGVRGDRKFEIGWVAHLADKTYAYPIPLPNKAGEPSPPPSADFPPGGREWTNIREAVGGGPVLVKDGVLKMTAIEELFGPTHYQRRHPRTAVGFTAQNHLILFTIDGRRPTYSMGMSLDELAVAMKDLGCVDALNLDGGGSSAMVVEGKTINQPSDGTERRVTSILAIVPDPELRVLLPGEKPKFMQDR